MNSVRTVLRTLRRRPSARNAANGSIFGALQSASDRRLDDLGAETAAIYLTSLGAETVMLAGDVSSTHCAEPSGPVLVAVIDEDLIVFEVKTRFRSPHAGTLTSAGNLARPALGSHGAEVLTERVRTTIDAGDRHDSLLRRAVVVDLKAMLIQQFWISADGRALTPLGRPCGCQTAVERALDTIVAHRRCS